MQITNVEDLVGSPGAVRATFEDGTSMVVPRSKLPPQLQLANSGATAQNMSVDPGVGSPAPMASTGPTNPQEFATKWEGPPVAPQQASDFAPQPVGQPPMRPITVQSGGDFVGGMDAPQAPIDPRQLEIARLRSPYKVVRGSPAFDPKKEAARRSPVPVSQTIQQSGARAYDPEALQDAQEKERKALEMQAEGNMLQANAKLQADQIMHQEVSNLYRQQQAEQQAREAEFNSKQATLDDEAKAVAAREIDPNRVFKNMSIFQSLGLAIAAGLKGYASQGRDNSVMDSLMHRMDADIRAQEHDIQVSKGRVDNALARLSQQFGSIQAGKAALKDQQLSVIMAKNTATAAEIGTAIAKANADAANLKLEAEQAKLREQRWSEAQGQTTIGTSAAMMSPKAATRGGLARKSDAESLKGWEAADKLEGNKATTEGKQLENLEKRGELTGAIPGKASEQVTKYGAERLKVEGAKARIQSWMGRNGIKKDDRGNYVTTSSQIPGVGPSNLWEPGSWQSETGKRNNAELNQMKADIALIMYGASTPEQLATVDDLFLSRTNEGNLAAGLGAVLEATDGKLRTLDAAYGGKTVKEFESRRSQMGAEKKALQAGISEPE